MSQCNRDCFNCMLRDCSVDTLSSEERKEIRERDNRYYNATGTGWMGSAKPTKTRRRKNYI